MNRPLATIRHAVDAESRQAAERLVNLLDIPLGGSPALQHSGRLRLPSVQPVAIGDRMPDLTGTAKRSLLPLLEREDLQVVFVGEGYVVRQSPPPGETVQEGMTLRLEFE